MVKKKEKKKKEENQDLLRIGKRGLRKIGGEEVEFGGWEFFFFFLLGNQNRRVECIYFCLLMSKMALPNLRDTELCSQKKRRERKIERRRKA